MPKENVESDDILSLHTDLLRINKELIKELQRHETACDELISDDPYDISDDVYVNNPRTSALNNNNDDSEKEPPSRKKFVRHRKGRESIDELGIENAFAVNRGKPSDDTANGDTNNFSAAGKSSNQVQHDIYYDSSDDGSDSGSVIETAHEKSSSSATFNTNDGKNSSLHNNQQKSGSSSNNELRYVNNNISMTRTVHHFDRLESQNQCFFLNAALALLKEKAEWNAQVLEEHRNTCPELPPANEVIMTGCLKKAKDGQFMHWKTKFVAISPGRMTYLLHDEQPNITNLFRGGVGNALSVVGGGKADKAKKAKQKLQAAKINILNPTNTFCNAVDKKRFKEEGKYVFEVVTHVRQKDGNGKIKSVGRLWMASSFEERARWMHAIQTAMNTELYANEDQLVLTQNDKMRRKVQACSTKSEYFNALSDIFKIEDDDDAKSVVSYDEEEEPPSINSIRVPIEWIQSTMHRPRGDVDPSMEQVFKDMQRDSMTINGELYTGCEEFDGNNNEETSSSLPESGGVVCMIGALARAIKDKGGDVQMTESQALAFSREVLLACNRTQSGGNTYEAVDLICGNHDLVFIVAESQHASPLRITVYNEDEMSLASTANTSEVDGFDEDEMELENEEMEDKPVGVGRIMHRFNSRTDDSELVPNSTVASNQSEDMDGKKKKKRGWRNGIRNISQNITSHVLLNNLNNMSNNPNTNCIDENSSDYDSYHGGNFDVPTYPPVNPSVGNVKKQDAALHHRRTASEPVHRDQLSLNLQGNQYSNTGTLNAGQRGHIQTSMLGSIHSGSNTPNSQSNHHRSLTTTNSLISSSIPLSTSALLHNAGKSYRLSGPHVDVEASMSYKICNSSFDDETDSTWGFVTAVYQRSFVMAGESTAVALGQGSVFLSLNLNGVSCKDSTSSSYNNNNNGRRSPKIAPPILINTSSDSNNYGVNRSMTDSPIHAPNKKPSKSSILKQSNSGEDNSFRFHSRNKDSGNVNALPVQAHDNFIASSPLNANSRK